MRISPINYNINSFAPIKNNQTIQKTSMNKSTQGAAFAVSKSPSFTGYGSGKYKISEIDLKQISELIRKTDSQRLDESGKTLQGVYPYAGKYMVKSPDTLLHDTALKEYAILSKIRELKGGEEICPRPFEIAQSATRPFLVEEFIQGKHAGELPISLKEVEKLTEKILILDKGGIINQDLSPRNVIYMPNGETRMIDFDTFSYLVGDGRIFHSQSTPIEFFATLVPKKNLKNLSSANLGEFDFKNLESSIEEKFAASFTSAGKRPWGLRDLFHARNVSDNPFIGVPSNLANYEARTLYTRIMDHDIEDPVGFLQNYIQMKAEKYHKPMREFIAGLKINEDMCDGMGDRLTVEEAKSRLEKAIRFEDIYINMFTKEKPDVYFAKLEAAEIQLNALVAEARVSKHLSNSAQVPKAYENVIRVLMEGLDKYDDPDTRYFLDSQLERYKHLFSHTDLSITQPPHRIDATMDILDMWFSDSASDGNSFATLGRKARPSIISLFRENGIKENKTVSDEVMQQAETLLRQELEPSKTRVPDNKFEEGVKRLLSSIMEEARTMKDEAPKKKPELKYDEKGFATNIKEVFGIATTKLHFKETTDEALDNFSDTYEVQKYVKSGGKLLIGICALAAVGGGILYKYMQAKNKKKELQKQVLIQPEQNYPQTNITRTISKDENSPFKSFLV